MTTGKRVCTATDGLAGPKSRHRVANGTVRPPSSRRTLRPSLMDRSAVSQCAPGWSWRYSTRTGCRCPGSSAPNLGDTEMIFSSSTNRWCASTSLAGSPISTQFSRSTSGSLRSSSRHSTGIAPTLHTSKYTAVGSAPSTPTPRPVAIPASGRNARADENDPSKPPVCCILVSAGVGASASCALSALMDSCLHSDGLDAPSHATSVTRRVG